MGWQSSSAGNCEGGHTGCGFGTHTKRGEVFVPVEPMETTINVPSGSSPCAACLESMAIAVHPSKPAHWHSAAECAREWALYSHSLR